MAGLKKKYNRVLVGITPQSNGKRLIDCANRVSVNVGGELHILHIQKGNDIIPIEVKTGIRTKSKSLNIFVEKYTPSYSVRISSKNFGFENNIKSVPLYAVFCL